MQMLKDVLLLLCVWFCLASLVYAADSDKRGSLPMSAKTKISGDDNTVDRMPTAVRLNDGRIMLIYSETEGKKRFGKEAKNRWVFLFSSDEGNTWGERKTFFENDSYTTCSECNGTGKISKLNMNMHIRSNCAYEAAFMNMHALVELQAYVANRLGVLVGEYIHLANSFHIYGSYFDEFKGFLETIKNRTFEQRVWDSSYATEFFIDGCNQLLAEEDMPEGKKRLVEQRKRYLESL